MKVALIGLLLITVAAPCGGQEGSTFPSPPSSLDKAVGAMEEIKGGQVAVDEAQDQTTRHLSFAQRVPDTVAGLQKAAEQAQEEANRAVSEINTLHASMKKFLTEAKVFHGYAQGAARKRASSIASAAEHEAALVQLRSQAEMEQKKLDNPETFHGLSKNAAETLKRETGEKLRALKYKIGQSEGHLTHARKEIRHFEEGSAKAWDTYLENVRRLSEARKRLPAALEQARETQRRALEAQRTALNALAALPESDVGKENDTNTGATQNRPPEVSRVPDSPQPQARPTSVLDALRESETTESRIAERYRNIRAIDLASIRELSIAEARSSTDLPQPVRETFDTQALESTPLDQDAMQAFNQAMEKVLTQVDSRVRFANQLLVAVYPTTASELGGGGSSISVRGSAGRNGGAGSQGSGSSAAVGRMLEAAATDAEGSDAKDLTTLMRASYDDINPYDDSKDPTGIVRGDYVPPSEIPDEERMMAAKPGRHVASGLPGAPWIYVSGWHLIGPFPNPDRRNKDRQFPPEIVIDLDAIYEGRDEKPVRWRFEQSGRPALMLPEAYSITYAYTELWFDEARDLWIAAGADDAGRLWINDLLVWKSTDRLKPWRISEAYRKVSFVKGLNRVLYRIENGPDAGWFSLLLQTDGNAAASPQVH